MSRSDWTRRRVAFAPSQAKPGPLCGPGLSVSPSVRSALGVCHWHTAPALRSKLPCASILALRIKNTLPSCPHENSANKTYWLHSRRDLRVFTLRLFATRGFRRSKVRLATFPPMAKTAPAPLLLLSPQSQRAALRGTRVLVFRGPSALLTTAQCHLRTRCL